MHAAIGVQAVISGQFCTLGAVPRLYMYSTYCGLRVHVQVYEHRLGDHPNLYWRWRYLGDLQAIRSKFSLDYSFSSHSFRCVGQRC